MRTGKHQIVVNQWQRRAVAGSGFTYRLHGWQPWKAISRQAAARQCGQNILQIAFRVQSIGLCGFNQRIDHRADLRAQAVDPCVHAGFSAYKPDALAVTAQFRFPCSLLDYALSSFPVLYSGSYGGLCKNSLAHSEQRWHSSGSNAAVLPAPRAYLLTVRFLQGSETTGTAATFSDPYAAPARSIRTTGAFLPKTDLLSDRPSTTGYGRRRCRNGAVCRDPILAESLFRSSDRSERAADTLPAAFPAISYNGTAAGSVFRKTTASARLRRSARLASRIPLTGVSV